MTSDGERRIALSSAAQHDASVRELLQGSDPIGESAAVVIARALPGDALRLLMSEATAALVGRVFFWVLSGRAPAELHPQRLAEGFLRVASREPGPAQTLR